DGGAVRDGARLAEPVAVRRPARVRPGGERARVAHGRPGARRRHACGEQPRGVRLRHRVRRSGRLAAGHRGRARRGRGEHRGDRGDRRGAAVVGAQAAARGARAGGRPACSGGRSPGRGSGRVIEGVLFDVDDTLVDTKGAFAVALEAIRAQYLPHVPPERGQEILSHWRTDPGGFYRRYTRGEMDHDTQRLHRAVLLHETFDGPPVTEEGFAAWDEIFWGTFERSWTAHVDARAAVDAVLAAGLRAGVVTNAAAELQERKLELAGLADLPVLVGVDTLGVGKPDPRVFLEGARLLGTDPVRTAYVGDEPTVDALAAHEAGLTGVWIDRAGHRRGPGYGGPTLPGRTGGDSQDPDALRAAGVVVVETLDELPAALGYGRDA